MNFPSENTISSHVRENHTELHKLFCPTKVSEESNDLRHVALDHCSFLQVHALFGNLALHQIPNTNIIITLSCLLLFAKNVPKIHDHHTRCYLAIYRELECIFATVSSHFFFILLLVPSVLLNVKKKKDGVVLTSMKHLNPAHSFEGTSKRSM